MVQVSLSASAGSDDSNRLIEGEGTVANLSFSLDESPSASGLTIGINSPNLSEFDVSQIQIVGGEFTLSETVEAQIETVLASKLSAVVPGGAIATTSPLGNFSGAAGLANIETETFVTPDDRFVVGSVAKTFTATTLLKLVEAGSLTLDDRLTDWLPDSVTDNVPNASDITLRQLLNHTSGVPEYDFILLEQGMSNPFIFLQDWQPSAIIELIADSEAVFAPGEGWQYANTNFILAGMVIEAATGNSLADEIQSKIIDPLGLENTFLSTTKDTVPGGYISGYLDFDNNDVLDDVSIANLSWSWASGAVVSDTDDLTRYARALYAGDLLNDATRAEKFTLVDTGRGYEYGLGMMSFDTPDLGRIVGHRGGSLGFNANMWYAPEDDFTYVELLNGRTEEALVTDTISAFRNGPIVDIGNTSDYSQFNVTLTDQTAQVSLPVVDDGISEGEEIATFSLEPEDGEQYEISADASTVVLTIDDVETDSDGIGSTNVFEQFASSQALEEYLVAQAVEQYEFLFGTFAGFIPVPVEPPVPEPTPELDPGEDDTNNQVDGVDEADLVETDGEFIYQVNGQALTVVDATDASELAIASQGRVPSPWLLNSAETGNETLPVEPFFPIGGPVGGWSNIDGIYLQDDRLTVISSGYGPGEFPIGPPIDAPAIDIYFPPGDPQVQVTVLDVSEPTDISILESSVIEGNLVSSRAIGDDVFVVTSNNLQLPAPLIIDGTYETKAEYLARIEGQILDLALPNIETRNRPGEPLESGLLSDPKDIYTPFTPNLYQQLTTVSTFDVGDNDIGVDNAVSITTESINEIFSSVDNLYLLRQDYTAELPGTQIWKVNLDTSDLLAFGEVPGVIDSQFSVDEDQGFLRISTTSGFGEEALNNVYVLEQDGSELDVVGSIEGLAPGERIFSTRFDGDYGFMVTFRQIDPLFTLDLSNPQNPQVTGELKLPGFSEYLQVIEQDDQTLLLGIGLDADPITGIQGNLKVSLFDVTDLDSPIEIDSFIFEGDFTSSEALWEHKAIRYVPSQNLLAIPTQIYDDSTFTTTSALTVFEIDGQTGIARLGTIEHDGAWINRSLSIQGDLFAVSSQQISSHSVPVLNLLSTVEWSGEPDYLTWSTGSILGTDAADTLVGDEFGNTVNGQGGNDTLAGGLGDDRILGGQGDDVLRGDLNSRQPQNGEPGGNDIIFGGEGNDRIGGKAGNDILNGDAGDDTIWGDNGDDILMGVTGNDILIGDNFSDGSGSDLFVFGSGDGTDTILDFEIGRDRIGLVEGELELDDLSFIQDGENTLLGVASSGEILAVINNVQASALGETSFESIPDVSNLEQALALI